MGANLDSPKLLNHHIKEVVEGKRYFENVFQSLSRMILGEKDSVEKVTVNGKSAHNFKIFRQGKKHPIEMHDEINQLVGFIKDASEGGISKDKAFVLIGEPGNGKTFLLDYLQKAYRNFASTSGNEKYTFKFKNLDKLKIENNPYEKLKEIRSQTYEDPMILAMNLFENEAESRKRLIKILESESMKAKDIDKNIEKFFSNYRPLGACTDYILNQIKESVEDIDKILKDHVDIIPVKISTNSGVLTGKYSAKDKITASAANLVGEESIQRLLFFPTGENPYRYDLLKGTLSRSAGGGIHFADEIFKNKLDLITVYLGVIENREIDIDGFKWPMDTMIVATSNNADYDRIVSDAEAKPMIDRCKSCYVSHNVNYKSQKKLTRYMLGDKENKRTLLMEKLHEDPNLEYVLSVGASLIRMPNEEETRGKLSKIEAMKLAAGESAGEKGIKILREVVEDLADNLDIQKRFGHKGLSQRLIGEVNSRLEELPKTTEVKCKFAGDAFYAFKRVIADNISDENKRTDYCESVDLAEGMYFNKVMESIYNALYDDPEAIKKDVLKYVHMVRYLGDPNFNKDEIRTIPNPENPEKRIPLEFDQKYVISVEERLGLKTKEETETYRRSIRDMFSAENDVVYDFMDNNRLVEAVTNVSLKSEINNHPDIRVALANQTNENNKKLENRLVNAMRNKLEYCDTCAEKTIRYFVGSLEKEN